MGFIKSITAYKELQDILHSEEEFLLIYFTIPACGVCTVIRPVIEAFLSRYPQIKGYSCNLEDDPLIAGQLTLHSAPMILAFFKGKEVFREGRFIVMEKIEQSLLRILEITGLV